VPAQQHDVLMVDMRVPDSQQSSRSPTAALGHKPAARFTKNQSIFIYGIVSRFASALTSLSDR
jgi:hypothetical protein